MRRAVGCGVLLLWAAAAFGGPLKLPARDTWLLAFSPDGKRLAAGTSNGRVHVWSTDTGEVEFVRDYGTTIHHVSFSPSGRHFVFVAYDEVTLLDVETWQPVESWREKFRVLGVAFSPDGKRMVVGMNDVRYNHEDVDRSGIDVRRTDDWSRVRYVEIGQPLQQILWSPDGRSLIMSVGGGPAMTLDTSTWKPSDRYAAVPIFSNNRPLEPRRLALSPDSRVLLAVGNRADVIGWDTKTGREVFRQLLGITPMDVAFSPDGRLVVGGSSRRLPWEWKGAAAWVRRAEDGRLVGTIEDATGVFRSGRGNVFTRVVFSPDGKRIATAASNAGGVRIWNLEEILEAHGGGED